MRVMIVADGRSPITFSWVQRLIGLGHQVVLVSTYSCQQMEGIEKLHILPVAFAGFGGSQSGRNPGSASNRTGLRHFISRFRSLFMAGRYYFGPWNVSQTQSAFRQLVDEVQPDLVHALRIPFEGMLASYTPAEIPLAVSIWGNDLTFHAVGSPWMKAATQRTLRRADALVADAARDIRLGRIWGFSMEKPTLVVPGNGGLNLELIPDRKPQSLSFLQGIPPQAAMVVNPRGFRPGSVRNDIFFYAMPLVLQRNPDVYFICPGMAGQSQAYRWVRNFRLEKRVKLLPLLPQEQLWNLFSQAQIFASISSHDGTPNSFLEAIACGSFPVVGDIESLREWVTPGINGFVVEPSRPQEVAEAILQALEDDNLRQQAALYNHDLIEARASSVNVSKKIDVLYQNLVKTRGVEAVTLENGV
jgi:glycosyltransferase involved in cell wall biosynthesis